jgi:iron(III) transport system ATP-binding protein
MGGTLRLEIGSQELGSAMLAPSLRQNSAESADYLIVNRVGKKFDKFVALDDVSLAIGSGEFVSFLGPSGCGKTTLLRAIAGLDPPTSGRITQAGKDITGLPPAQRDFGIVFQSYALFPNLTIAENVGYGLRGAAWPRARAAERVQELLTVVGLPEQSSKYPSQLSGGQQQRVALARALAMQPSLLLLDEPLSALDAIVRVHLRSEIRALQRKLGVTTIMVTHDQEEAMSVSDRIVVMSQGHIEQIGTAEDIYRKPASAFVATFVGRSSAFDATVQRGAVVAESGLRLAADAARGLPDGQKVRVFIRPEDVLIGRATATWPDSFEGRVTNVEFLGPVCRLELDIGSFPLEVDVRSDDFRSEGMGSERLNVAVPQDRVLVYTAS